jgi:hypothetical protein
MFVVAYSQYSTVQRGMLEYVIISSTTRQEFSLLFFIIIFVCVRYFIVHCWSTRKVEGIHLKNCSYFQ